ncbi:MAG: Ig-like domain-containing protein [Planctomycetota bacterium]
MIRKLNLLVLLVALGGVVGLVAFMNREQVRGGGGKEKVVRIKGKMMRLYGDEPYTLAELARHVADPDLLSYDPERREAVAKASLVVHGGLRIGDPEDRRKGETLVLDTVVCGDLRLEVAPEGRLEVYHSDIRTKTMKMTADACSLGYFFFVDGRLEAADSRFLYMSGSGSKTAKEGSSVALEDVVFALADGCAFHTDDADGARMDIRDSTFSCEGQFGFLAEGSSGKPIVLRRCKLVGQLADLALRGRGAQVELIDCGFAPSKVKFYHRSGRATVRWTVRARVVTQGGGEPVPGATVAATSTGEGPAETIEARTGEDGTCRLVLTDYVATPEAPLPMPGVNDVTPHRLVVRSAAGKVLAERPAYRASGPEDELVLEVPAQALTASR